MTKAVENWKKTVVNEGQKISISLFRKIVKEAKEITNRTFDFRIPKNTILKNIKTSSCTITAFNGFKSRTYGDNACYILERSIGITGGKESIVLLIRL